MNKMLHKLGMLFALSLCGGTLYCQGSTQFASLVLKSSAFRDENRIPKRYTCDGENLSPPLSWEFVPVGIKSFVLVCYDPDAPGRSEQDPWVHWVVYNIPSSRRVMPEGFGNPGKWMNVKRQEGIVHGRTSFYVNNYGGPCPPPDGKTHRYFFKLYALRVAKLAFEKSSRLVDKEDVEEKMKPYVIGKVGQVMGTYKK